MGFLLPIVFHPDYQFPLRPNHPFPVSKYGYLRRTLEDRGLFVPGKSLAPAPLGPAQIELAHDPAYVARAFKLELRAEEVKRIGLPCTERVIRRSRLSSAGTLIAAWLALESGIACNAAGGSHHAGPASGAGFCVFNDVAVAIRNLRAQGVPGPMLVIDADVHQGDGTARIFADDPSVFTVSLHAQDNYPFDKSSSDMDVPLPDGADGRAYLAALTATLDSVFEAIAPTLVFYNAGVDVHVDDRLGRLSLSAEDIRLRDRVVIQRVRSHGIPIVGVLGGGYSNDPELLATLHASLFEEAAAAQAAFSG